MDKKLIHELSTEELLESLSGQDLINEKVQFSYENPILSFIQAFNIKAGKEKVSDAVLHSLFRIWHIDTVIDQRNFNIQLGRYIPSEVRNRRFYLVDKKVLELTNKIEQIKKDRSVNRSKSIHWHKHFERYLEETTLSPGLIFVEADILYYTYTRWVDITRLKQWLSYENFLKICNLNFEKKRISDSKLTWFGVNTSIKQIITKEEVKRWREGRKKYGKRKSSKEETTSTDQNREVNSKILYKEKKVKKKSRSLRGSKSRIKFKNKN